MTASTVLDSNCAPKPILGKRRPGSQECLLERVFRVETPGGVVDARRRDARGV